MNTIDGDLGIESVCDGPVALSFCPFFFWVVLGLGVDDKGIGGATQGFR